MLWSKDAAFSVWSEVFSDPAATAGGKSVKRIFLSSLLSLL